MLGLNQKPGALSADQSSVVKQKPLSFVLRLMVIVFCTFGLVFSGPPLVHAEDEATGENGSQQLADTQQAENAANAGEVLASEEIADAGVEEDAGSTADAEEAPIVENDQELEAQPAPAESLEIGPENVSENVAEPNAKLAPPTDIVAISGTKEVKGQAEATNDRNRQLRAYVYAKDPKSEPNQIPLGESTAGKGNGKFTVKLQEPLASGQVLYIVLKQENKKGSKWIPDGVESDPISVSVSLSLADQYDADLVVPQGKFLHEDQSTRSDEETSEIFEAFKEINPAIAGYMKAINLYNVSQEELSAEIVYNDNSKGARKLIKIELITELSAEPIVDKLLVTGNTVAGTLQTKDGQQVKPGTKVKVVTTIDSNDRKNFEPGARCNVDKSQATYADVDAENGTFSVDVGYDTLKLNWPGSSEGEIGIIVKEPKKLPTCKVIVPEGPLPEKTPVRDPKKLTKDDKKRIDPKIRQAYTTVTGISKMPDGTGDWENTPALIDFNADGDARIANPSNSVGDWDQNWTFVPKQDEDGRYELNNPEQVKSIAAKDLVTNIKPRSPKITVDYDSSTVTITPPAYTDPGDDTDLASYRILYDGKTINLTRSEPSGSTGSWSSSEGSIDPSAGTVTLQIKDLSVGATITAIATDRGGLVEEETPLDSDPVSVTLETATVSYDANGGSGTMPSTKMNKGLTYKILPNGFTAPENKEFDHWEIDGKTVAANSEITIMNDTVVKAIWKDVMVNVSYDANGGSGKMEGKELKKGSSYTILPNAFTAPENKEFDHWEIDGKTVATGSEITVNENTTITAVWKDKPTPTTTETTGDETETTPTTTETTGDETEPTLQPEPTDPTEPETTEPTESETAESSETTPSVETGQTTPTGSTPTQSGAKQKLAKTGLNAAYPLYAALFLLATGGLLVAIRSRKNRF